MNKNSLRGMLILTVAGAALCGSVMPAGAVERSLLGVRIYSNVKVVLTRLGNPKYVLTSGQAIPGFGGAAGGSTPGAGPSLPPLQPSDGNGQPSITYNPGNGPGTTIPLGSGPVQAFGMGGDDAGNAPGLPSATQAVDTGEVTLVYQKNDDTFEVLLSPSGSVIQVTALGYADGAVRTSRNITFGSGLTDVESKYGYPENTTTAGNGVEVLDYSTRAHVAFELVNEKVVGIVVAAVD